MSVTQTSTDINEPISTYTGTNGMTVRCYNDGLTAKQVYDHVTSNFLVGPEASGVTIYFAWTANATSSSVSRSNGVPTRVRSSVSVTWARWERSGDRTLAHEYGHAWSVYHTHMTLDDDRHWLKYLRARGLEGDDRIGSSYMWMPGEIIAEDYRLLFGSENAKQGNHMNWNLPHPNDVRNLEVWLRDVFFGGEEEEIIGPEVPDEPEPPGPEEPDPEEPPVEEPEPPVEEPEPPVEEPEPPVEEPDPEEPPVEEPDPEEPPVEEPEPPVEEPEPEPLTSLHVSTTKERGVNHATLIWTGIVSASVSIYRDGQRIVSVPNTGRYFYNTGERGSRTVVLRVCAGDVCTPEREASW